MEPKERMYRQRILRRLHSRLAPGLRVLDAGCGPGAGAELLCELGCRVTGIDVGDYAADWERRRRLGIRFERKSAEATGFPDAAFDAVWIMDVLHHLAWPEKTLAELLRVAKPGAPVMVIETNRQSPLTYLRMTLLAGHETFSRRRFRRLLAAIQPEPEFFMVETRCLPWNWPWALWLLNRGSDLLEGARLFRPWLTYQVGVLRGVGRPVAPKIDPREPERRRRARADSEARA